MIVKYTAQELAEIKSLENKYKQAFLDVEQLIKSLRHDPWPDTSILFNGINGKDHPAAWAAAVDREREILAAWRQAGPAEWQDAEAKHNALIVEEMADWQKLFERFELRQFLELGGDLIAVLADGKAQTDEIIVTLFNARKEWMSKPGKYSAIDVVSLGGGKWKLDATETRSNIARGLHLHFKTLENSPDLLEDLNRHIMQAVANSPHIAPEGTPGRGAVIEVKRSRTDVTLFEFDLNLHGEKQRTATGPKQHRSPAIFPEQINIDALNGFYMTRQDPDTRAVFQHMASDYKQVDMMGNATIKTKNLRIKIKGYQDQNIEEVIQANVGPGAAILYDILVSTAVRQGFNDTLIKLDIDEYMKMRGITNRAWAYEDLKINLTALGSIEFEYKKGKHWLDVPLAQERGVIDNGVIIFRFTEVFREKIIDAYLTLVAPDTYQPNLNQFPYAVFFYRRMQDHKRINAGDPNEQIIPVKTLVDSCPNFPNPKNVNGKIKERIIAPFENNLDAYESLAWEWVFDGYDPITNPRPKGFPQFIGAKIRFSIDNFPEEAMQKLINSRKKRASKIEKSKFKAAKAPEA